VRLFIEVKNQGGAPLPQGMPTPLAIRISGLGRVINLVSMVHTDGIAPGETVTIERGTNGPWTGPLSFNSEKAGTYTVTVVADRDNLVAESNESNNAFNYKINYQGPQNLSVYAMERATRSYASVASVDSVITLLRASQKLDPMSSQAIIRGVADGWGTKRQATVREADKSFVASLSKTASLDNIDRINKLMIAWGLKSAEEKADLDAQIVFIKVVREALKFDTKEFTVRAGKPVEVVIENPDAMQHNMVIGKPKTLEIIGAAADKMITAKDGAEKNYVPPIPQVVAATPLINPDQTYRFKFNAPTQPGNYPFVCTFPGHWRIMNGVMKVE
jgi:azurin